MTTISRPSSVTLDRAPRTHGTVRAVEHVILWASLLALSLAIGAWLPGTALAASGSVRGAAHDVAATARP